MSNFQIDIHLVLNFCELWRYPWSRRVRRQSPLLPALFMSVLRHFTWNRFLPLWKKSLLYFTHQSNFWIPVFAGFSVKCFATMLNWNLCRGCIFKDVLFNWRKGNIHKWFKKQFFSWQLHSKWLFTNFCSNFFFLILKNTPGKPDSIHYKKSLHWFGCIRTPVSSRSLVTLKAVCSGYPLICHGR